jgi:hypothetical protein
MYFEHLLNNIILHVCQKKKLENKFYKMIVKSVNIEGKLRWMMLYSVTSQ